MASSQQRNLQRLGNHRLTPTPRHRKLGIELLEERKVFSASTWDNYDCNPAENNVLFQFADSAFSPASLNSATGIGYVSMGRSYELRAVVAEISEAYPSNGGSVLTRPEIVSSGNLNLTLPTQVPMNTEYYAFNVVYPTNTAADHSFPVNVVTNAMMNDGPIRQVLNNRVNDESEVRSNQLDVKTNLENQDGSSGSSAASLPAIENDVTGVFSESSTAKTIPSNEIQRSLPELERQFVVLINSEGSDRTNAAFSYTQVIVSRDAAGMAIAGKSTPVPVRLIHEDDMITVVSHRDSGDCGPRGLPAPSDALPEIMGPTTTNPTTPAPVSVNASSNSNRDKLGFVTAFDSPKQNAGGRDLGIQLIDISKSLDVSERRSWTMDAERSGADVAALDVVWSQDVADPSEEMFDRESQTSLQERTKRWNVQVTPTLLYPVSIALTPEGGKEEFAETRIFAQYGDEDRNRKGTSREGALGSVGAEEYGFPLSSESNQWRAWMLLGRFSDRLHDTLARRHGVEVHLESATVNTVSRMAQAAIDREELQSKKGEELQPIRMQTATLAAAITAAILGISTTENRVRSRWVRMVATAWTRWSR